MTKASTTHSTRPLPSPIPPTATWCSTPVACQMAVHNHMRTAKLAKDYLTAHSKEVDEPMVNAWGRH